ncbi:tubulin-tyrosine ligase family-domain-containing protein [Boletus reticuloceps]|uniref:Tubulin-tyrosine ligase family-domain-containing protein n=1 Tax=Boletus reticuloceps TaxID=495285 RepID=A0A8I2YXV0_9AGAM|nr:tubulin-tyrosine ligase family-domain-containing protein [Boletus reticuloceps]
MNPAILVAWPSAPLTTSLVHTSIAALGLSASVLSLLPSPLPPNLIQWASYDCIDHDLTASQPNHVLSSSYTIRKALIRKHFLARCIQSYLVKRPGSFLAKSVPLTWDIDIAYADELDEMWSDELWDLGSTLDANSGDTKQWFILKPGMADRGMGIRLFDSKAALYTIFREFDSDSDDDEADESTTSVMTSQLRHFVLQEYVSTPLLVDPNEVQLSMSTTAQPCDLRGHKFHLRTYVVASGALTVFIYERILALFSVEPYHAPMRSDPEMIVSLTPHLTNTSLQTHRGEECVRLLDELIGCRILSGGKESSPNVLSITDVMAIKQQVADALSEAFKAALGQPIHFQAW